MQQVKEMDCVCSQSSESTIKYNIRSISLPTTTHPTTQRVEDELKKLKSWKKTSALSSTSAGDICYGLSSLQELYECTDDLLNLPLTIQSLSNHQNEKRVDELLDKSVRLLDICGIAKDMVSQCKQNVRELQSSLRRGKGLDNYTIETSISKYFSCSTKMKKEAKSSLASLKKINQGIFNASSNTTTMLSDLDHHVISVIRVLQKVNFTSISVFKAVMRFLALQSYKQKVNRWALVARLVRKERGVGSGSSNEIENAEAILIQSLCENDQIEKGDFHHIVQNRLQILEGSFECLENQFEAMFRCLIRSRTTLLNVFSC